MQINHFKHLLHTNTDIEFDTTLQVIADHFIYHPTQFMNGVSDNKLVNKAGQNEGACKIFAFALHEKLDEKSTLQCFGNYYRDVLATPEGQDHANIRTFMQSGWAGIEFEGQALTRKAT